MGVVFKKNGRPTKKEKLLLKNINSHISSMGDDASDYNNETVTHGNRLEEIWNSITAAPQEKEVSKENEIKEQSINLENMQEGEEIINEANEGIDTQNDMGVPSSFNPLSEPIVQRSYVANNQTDVGEIEEPVFEAQSSPREQLKEIEEEEEFQFEEAEEEVVDEPNGFENVSNPQMEELDDKDKKLAAKQLVQTVLDGYEMLHEVGKSFVKYPEDKLQEKIINQEIDPTMEIPLDENGTTTNPVEFFQNFNEQAEEAISYDPEFGEKVKPAMERVFSKKGWGMTDEQFLLIAFGKDIAWKSVQIMTLKKTASGIMNTFERLQQDKIEAMRQSQRAQPRPEPVVPDSIVTPPSRAEEPPSPEIVADDVTPEVVDDKNEIIPIH
jgi:hypothetical protein